MNVLITGASGFLGRQVSKKSLKRKWQVTAVYNNNKNAIPCGCRGLHISELPRVRTDFDLIFHLAAYIPYRKMNQPDPRLINVNIKLTLLLTEIFQNSKIIYASSTAVYGTPTGIIDEFSQFNRPSLYGQSKLSSEFIIQNHPKFSIVRFSSLYGRSMPTKTFIPMMVEQAIKNGEIRLYGNGQRMQDYLHIGDAAEYCISAAINGHNESYLGVYGKSYSNLDVARIIQSLSDCQFYFTGEDSSPSFEYDNAYSRFKLAYSARKSLFEGISEILIDD